MPNPKPFTFTVTVEVERDEGKFISRDEISDQILEAIESADPGSIYVDESSYSVVTWEVTE